MPFRAALPILILACSLWIGCGSSTQTAAEPEIYDLHGEIVRILPEDNTVVVKHDEIVGWMNAMTMEFPVADPADLDRLQVGDMIDAKVRVEDLDYRLADIEVLPPVESEEPAEMPESGDM